MTHPAAEEAPVDLDGLEEMMREAEVLDILEELIELYLSEAPGRIADLTEGCERGDSGKVHAVAHAFRGASANLWANRLRDLLAEMEAAGARDDLPTARSLLPSVAEEYRAVERYLKGVGSSD